MIEILLTVALVSVMAFSVLYIRYLLARYREISEDLYIIKSLVSSYRQGLEPIYESELFYGEPVIERLVEGTKDLDRELASILDAYSFDEGEDPSGAIDDGDTPI